MPTYCKAYDMPNAKWMTVTLKPNKTKLYITQYNAFLGERYFSVLWHLCLPCLTNDFVTIAMQGILQHSGSLVRHAMRLPKYIA